MQFDLHMSHIQNSNNTYLELLVGIGILVTTSSAEHIQVVLLQEAKVLTGLGEFSLLHTLTDVPVDEGSLGVHKVELGNNSLAEDSADSDVVSDHGAVDGGGRQVIVGHKCGWLIIQSNLVTGWAPVHEGQFIVVLQPLDGFVGVLRLDVTSEEDGYGHVL